MINPDGHADRLPAPAFPSILSWNARDRVELSSDLRAVDLNLLVLFEALIRLRSVNRAAESVGLSRSAASRALARLRALLDDPLFVGREMEPTPRALELAPVVLRSIQPIQSEESHPQAAFEPARTERTFTILTPDLGEVGFLPGVLRQMRKEAPRVRLAALPGSCAAATDALERGDADLAVGFFPELEKSGYLQQDLFKTSYACIACARNTALAARMSQKQYLAAGHVVVGSDAREQLLDRFLVEKGWTRQAVVELAGFMSLTSVLPGTDLIATVPGDVAAVIGRLIALKWIDLPFRPPQLQIRQYWHRRMQDDCAHRWLRTLFHEASRRGVNAKRA